MKFDEKGVKQACPEVGRQIVRPNIRNALLTPKNAKNKYHNVKVEFDGMSFDSVKESTRWAELKLLQRAGQIYELRRQVVFEIIPTQRDEATGELVEKCARYIADFVYMEKGKCIVEDAKGVKTKEYALKKKLMKYFHNIEIKDT